MKHVLNESFSSNVIRALTYINSNSHINLNGKEEPALSKNGSAFLLSMPILWDKLSDANIKIYADHALATNIPQTDIVRGKADETQNKYDLRRKDFNTPFSIENTENRKRELDRVGRLTDAIGTESKSGILYALSHNADYYQEKLDDAGFDVTVDQIIGHFKQLDKMAERYRNSPGNMTLQTAEEIVSGVGDMSVLKFVIGSNDLCEIADNIYNHFVDGIRAIKNKEANNMPGGVWHHERIGRDLFTDAQNLNSLKYPTLKEFVDRCIELGMPKIYFEGLGKLTSAGDVYLTRSEYGKFRDEFNQNLLTILRHSDKSKEDRAFEFQHTMRSLRYIYISYVGSKRWGLKGSKGDTTQSYQLLQDLYRQIQPIGGKLAEVRNNIVSDKLFGEKMYDDAFRIVVLTDASFRILYVLSYYNVTNDPLILNKSKYVNVLYGWSFGDEVKAVERNIGNRGVGNPKVVNMNGEDFVSYNQVSLENVSTDDKVVAAIVISGSDSVEEKTNSIKRYIYGKFSSLAGGNHDFTISGFERGENGEIKNIEHDENGAPVLKLTQSDIANASSDPEKLGSLKAKLAKLENPDLDDLIPNIKEMREQLRNEIAALENPEHSELSKASVDGLCRALKNTGVGSRISVDDDIVTVTFENDIEAEAFINGGLDVVLDKSNGGTSTIDVATVENSLKEIERLVPAYNMFKEDRIYRFGDFLKVFSPLACAKYTLKDDSAEYRSAINFVKSFDAVDQYSYRHTDNFMMYFTYNYYLNIVKDEQIRNILDDVIRTIKKPVMEYALDANNEKIIDPTTGKFLKRQKKDEDGNVIMEYIYATNDPTNPKKDGKLNAHGMRSVMTRVNGNGAKDEDASRVAVETMRRFVEANANEEPIMTVKDDVIDVMISKINGLNDYLRSRQSFLRIAFEGASEDQNGASTLTQLFNGYGVLVNDRVNTSSPEAQRSRHIQYQKKSDANDISNIENHTEYENASEKAIEILNEILPLPVSRTGEYGNAKEIWNDVADNLAKYNTPKEFLGYDQFFKAAHAGFASPIIVGHKALLRDIYNACIVRTGVQQDDIEDIYGDFVNYLFDVREVFYPIVSFSPKGATVEQEDIEELKQTISDCVRNFFELHNKFIDSLNEKYAAKFKWEFDKKYFPTL